MTSSHNSRQKDDLSRLLSGGGQAVPLFKVYMSEEAIQAATDVLRSGFIGQGPRVEKFEQDLRAWVSSPHVLSVNSGTAALHLAMRLAGVEHGDEVVSTAMTCMATNVPILANGGKVVWADINPNTGNIDPKSVEKKITAKTKAVVCVDWGGYPCDLEELYSITQKHGIKLIQDCAHGFASSYKGKPIGGRFADFTCFSFQAIKHVTTVDGGALICANEADYKRGKLLRWFGIDREGPRTDFRCEEDVLEYGYKFHMNDVAAAIGSEQLKHAGEITSKHKQNAAFYNARFSKLDPTKVQLLDYNSDRESAYWLYTFKVHNRLEFMKYMKERQVVVSQVHMRNDGHTVFKDCRAELPGVSAFAEKQVSIPVGWWLTEEEREHVARSVEEFAAR